MADAETIANILNEAFFEDPLFAYFFPQRAKRRQQALHTMRFLARKLVAQGETYTEGRDTTQAVGLWTRNDRIDASLVDMLRFGALAMPLHQGIAAVWRQIRADGHMLKLNRQLLPAPHRYLFFLAVLPQHQGKGLASKLFEPALQRADEEHLPCYLDTHNPVNVPIYRHYGFRVAHEWILPGTDVRHWAMIRATGG